MIYLLAKIWPIINFSFNIHVNSLSVSYLISVLNAKYSLSVWSSNTNAGISQLGNHSIWKNVLNYASFVYRYSSLTSMTIDLSYYKVLPAKQIYLSTNMKRNANQRDAYIILDFQLFSYQNGTLIQLQRNLFKEDLKLYVHISLNFNFINWSSCLK